MEVPVWTGVGLKGKSMPIMKYSSRSGNEPVMRARAAILVLVASVLLAGCTGSQSSTPAVVAQGSPITTLALPSDAQSAVLADLHGTVEVKSGEGQWTLAQVGQMLTSGQHIRTGALSNATLAMYDGSRTYLGAEAEIVVDALDALTVGARVVQLTQMSGQSQHEVAQSEDSGSHYDVSTPAGRGTANGSEFTVMVLPGQLSQFWVEAGAVSVINENATVEVVAGQTTIILVGQPPTEAAFRITGEGQVAQIGTVGGEAAIFLASAPASPTNQNDKITLCHATGSATNPYVEITVAAAGATHGHAKHSGDIIPAPAGGCPTATPSTSSTATNWAIAGQSFRTTASTIIFGNPQPGDWVTFEGRLQADGSRVADRIVLASHSPDNYYEFTGQLEAIGGTAWTVSGRVVKVDEFTAIEAGLKVGDNVRVTGGIAAEGVFWATRLSHTEGAGSNFRFAGIIASMDQDVWVISGLNVTVGENATLDNSFVVGNPVVVGGIIKEDGTWLATYIDLVTPEAYGFEFVGEVQSINPWVVAGVGFDTTEWTEIDADLQEGNRVRVVGLVSTDGVWIAERIERLDTEHSTSFAFFGPVLSRDPWNVRGVALVVDERTTIKGDITVGEMVKVTGWILEDGTWLATEIKHTGLHLGQGCLLISSVVQSITDAEIILIDGQTLVRSGDLVEQGDLKEASLVRYQLCMDQDGVGKIVRIVVVYQYHLEDAPPATGKVVICHIPPGNPGNAHTIEVGQPAVAAHLAHGDTLGACPSERLDKKPKKDK